MNDARSVKKTKKTVFVIIAVIVLLAAIYLVYEFCLKDKISWNDVYHAVGNTADVDSLTQPTDADGFMSEDVAVAFLSVGQGDCAFIKAGKTIVMIDSGDWFSADAINAFLKENGIKKIDIMITTHPHTDHIGSFENVIQRHEVGEMLFSSFDDSLVPTNDTYNSFLRTLIDHSVPTRFVEKNETIELDMGKLTVLYAGMGSDMNNCSMVFRYDYEKTSFLFMGDAEFEVEDKLVAEGANLSCDVLKAGHHGTKYATGNGLLGKAGPEYVVISCGLDNQYGYPKQQVLNRIEKYGGKVLRTDLDGDVCFYSDGESLTLYCSDTKEAA